MLSLGCAQRDMTPKFPLPLAGFGFRRGDFESIHTQLTLSVFVFKQGAKTLAFIHGDLLWWGSDIIEKFEPHLKKIYPKMDFIFHTTHTHCAPHVCFSFASRLGQPNFAYIDSLLPLIVDALREAVQNSEEVDIFRRDGKSLLPINRRRKNLQGVVEMQPNTEGPVDQGLSLITFENTKGIRAAWVTASCHPTCSGDNRVSAEFQTMAVRKFFPGCGIYLQGFCGDTRPKIIKDGDFYRGSLDKESEEQSRLFFEEILQTAALPKRKIEAQLYVRYDTLNLPLAKDFPHKNRSAYVKEADAPGEWARHWSVFPIPSTQTVRTLYFSLGRGLSFLGLNAEVVTDYSLKLKQRFPQLICLGYTNGMTAYLPTAVQVGEGGYEAYDSMFWFMRAAPFSTEIEPLLLEHCSSLAREGENL